MKRIEKWGGSIMTENRPFVPWEQMNSFMIDAFKGYGVPEEDAKICADVLLESDRRGIESHGCNRFKPIYIDRIVKGTLLPTTEIEILKETPTTVVMDAHDGMGMVASYAMMKKLIEKAKANGMAGGAIRNSTHYGIAGYWSGMAAKEGLVGITGTNARPSIAPTFGVENMMGTNPLTFSLPTDEEFPFCIDCATSIVQRGKIEYYAREGKSVPAGMVISEQGEALTDSEQILKDLVAGTAALAPLGGIGEEMAGYKGYGYAAVVEILSAALSGGKFMKALTGVDENGKPQMYHLGHFFFVVDPDAFMGREEFKKIAGEICRELRASKKAPGEERIYTAGEKEHDVWLFRKDKGVPVGEAVQKDILTVRDALGLDYHFAFED
jgi:LDH2 family malate/lactate/ureidoglycolate dehydrogenase